MTQKLEGLVDSTPGDNRIMAPQVNFLNLVLPIDYLEKKHPDVSIDEIFRLVNDGGPFLIRNLDTAKVEPVSRHHADKRYWGSNAFFAQLYDTLTEQIDDTQLAYKIGKHTIDVRAALATTLGTLFGPRFALKKAKSTMERWNRTKSVDVEKTGFREWTVRLSHKPGIIVQEFALEYHRGIFEALAHACSLEDCRVRFATVDEPNNVYDFIMSWKKRRPLKKFFSMMFGPLLYRTGTVKSLVSRIEELEAEKDDLVRTLETHRQESALAAAIAVRQELSDEAIRLITGSIEANDKYTKGHSVRVAHYGLQTFKYLDPKMREEILEKDPDFESNFDNACKVHDMGKIGIPSRILKKPGRLTAEEYAIIKRHPLIMYDVLSNLKNWNLAAHYAVGHHEKYDGTGYPHGLRGREIPVASRIMAVGDVFDALTSQRAYRNPLSIDKAIDIIKKDTGTHFDPNVSKAFLDIPIDVVKDIMMLENYDQDEGMHDHPEGLEKRTD